jgi:hypothetical protein
MLYLKMKSNGSHQLEEKVTTQRSLGSLTTISSFPISKPLFECLHICQHLFIVCYNPQI